MDNRHRGTLPLSVRGIAILRLVIAHGEGLAIRVPIVQRYFAERVRDLTMRTSSLVVLALTIEVGMGCGQGASGQANTANSPDGQRDFDPKVAQSALSAAAAQAQSCEKSDGPHGSFRVELRYRN